MNAGKEVVPAISHCPGGEVSDNGKGYRGNEESNTAPLTTYIQLRTNLAIYRQSLGKAKIHQYAGLDLFLLAVT